MPRPGGARAVHQRQHGLPFELVTALPSGGGELSEQPVQATHWPWEESKAEPVALSPEERLSRLLGQQLEGPRARPQR